MSDPVADAKAEIAKALEPFDKPTQAKLVKQVLADHPMDGEGSISFRGAGATPPGMTSKPLTSNLSKLLTQSIRAEMAVGTHEHRDFAKRLITEPATDSAEKIGGMLRASFSQANLSPAVQESVRRDIMTFCSGSMVWASLACPVFNLTLDFYRALLVTDFGEMGPEPMKLPFPAFVIRCPEPIIEETRNLFIYPIADLAPGAEATYPSGIPELKGPHYTRMTLEASEKSAHRQAFTQWPCDITFDAFLKGQARKIEATDSVEAEATKYLGTTMDPNATATARRILGNLLLYVNANGGLPREKKLGADVPVEREHKTEPRFRVGRPIKLGPQIRAALARGVNRGDPAWKLAQRFVVRGHWRMQSHGPNHSLRRKQWIQPFWKGPENMTQALERTFEVE